MCTLFLSHMMATLSAFHLKLTPEKSYPWTLKSYACEMMYLGKMSYPVNQVISMVLVLLLLLIASHNHTKIVHLQENSKRIRGGIGRLKIWSHLWRVWQKGLNWIHATPTLGTKCLWSHCFNWRYLFPISFASEFLQSKILECPHNNWKVWQLLQSIDHFISRYWPGTVRNVSK